MQLIDTAHHQIGIRPADVVIIAAHLNASLPEGGIARERHIQPTASPTISQLPAQQVLGPDVTDQAVLVIDRQENIPPQRSLVPVRYFQAYMVSR